MSDATETIARLRNDPIHHAVTVDETTFCSCTSMWPCMEPDSVIRAVTANLLETLECDFAHVGADCRATGKLRTEEMCKPCQALDAAVTELGQCLAGLPGLKEE